MRRAPLTSENHQIGWSAPEAGRWPTPPAGYQQGLVIHYPAWRISIASVVLFSLLIPLLTWLIARWQASPSVITLPLTIEDAAVVWVAAVVTTGAHELIHILTLRSYGYQPSFGIAWRQFAAYAGAFGQYQRRQHAILVTLAPLLVITTLALPLLGAAHRMLVVASFGVLLTNTSGAAGDVYVAWRLLRLPPDALVYDLDLHHMLVFIPSKAERVSEHLE